MGRETENGAERVGEGVGCVGGDGGGTRVGERLSPAQHSFFVTFKSAPVREPTECVVGSWVEREFTETLAQKPDPGSSNHVVAPSFSSHPHARLMPHSRLTQTNLCLPAERHFFI